jgi:hypothetical protein
MMLLSGGVSEQLFYDKLTNPQFPSFLSNPGVRSDVDTALDAVEILILRTATPSQLEKILLIPLTRTQKFVCLEALYHKTLIFMKEHKQPVCSIADCLIQDTTLSKQQVEEFKIKIKK